jgi:hypothetical protein
VSVLLQCCTYLRVIFAATRLLPQPPRPATHQGAFLSCKRSPSDHISLCSSSCLRAFAPSSLRPFVPSSLLTSSFYKKGSLSTVQNNALSLCAVPFNSIAHRSSSLHYSLVGGECVRVSNIQPTSQGTHSCFPTHTTAPSRPPRSHTNHLLIL